MIGVVKVEWMISACQGNGVLFWYGEDFLKRLFQDAGVDIASDNAAAAFWCIDLDVDHFVVVACVVTGGRWRSYQFWQEGACDHYDRGLADDGSDKMDD